MKNEAIVLEESERVSGLAPRTNEESAKRWLAVLIAFVTLLVGVTSFLQADASARSARLNRSAQQDAISSTGWRARGQQQYAFSEYVAVREYDELRSQAQKLKSDGDAVQAGAYITATEQLTKLTPLLSPDYSKPRESDQWRIPEWERYQVDTWVVTG
ncbi:MAG: hypothetical protein LC737_00900, partial [Chloroflexi bacterium]|nr:hypothetical protein [Chloroflexota bacterium]